MGVEVSTVKIHLRRGREALAVALRVDPDNGRRLEESTTPDGSTTRQDGYGQTDGSEVR
jgi:hypothetical protein